VQAPPTCYRHPDRETYISCVRCRRPICPDCMIEAPVGFQCPECVAEGRATSRSPLTPMGGEVISNPIVTKVLIGICVAVFVLEMLAGLNGVVQQWGMSPAAVSLQGEFWRLLTGAFLHGGLLHIGFNMLVLWFVGPQLEALFGHLRYAVLYLVSAIGGSVASYAFGPFNGISVGASGAVFGLMAALIVAGHSMRRDVSQVLILLAINFVIGFVAPGIDWRAHLGGAVTGAAVAAVMAYAPQQSRNLWQTLGVLAIVGLLVVGMIVRTAQIQTAVVTGNSVVPTAAGVHRVSPPGDNYSTVTTDL
jgi:membrane associated rhomboid family serine protease